MPVYTPASPEARGVAERVLDTLLTHAGHLHHGRPGLVTPQPGAVIPTWTPVVLKRIPDSRQGEVLTPKRQRIGTYSPTDGQIMAPTGAILGRYQPAGLFPEAVAWLYRQVADIARLDGEIAARLASWAFTQDHRDLKVVLAAYLLVQDRAGQPVLEHGKRVFDDVDYREVGEAMLLLTSKDRFDPKMINRVYDVLHLPQIVAINRELGFIRGRNANVGRWTAAVHTYLRAREQNPKQLTRAVDAGFRQALIQLAQRSRYKPESPAFFQALRWRQVQHAESGHRTLGIGENVAAAESWAGLSEAEVCARIVGLRYAWKRITALLPPTVGVTPAVVLAANQGGAFSDRDLVILTPMLEDLGLVGPDAQDNPVKARWTAAVATVEDQRARNIAKNARTEGVREQLEAAADASIGRAVEAAMKDLHLRVLVDVSGSMSGSVPVAIEWTTRFLGGIPLDHLQVAVFNSIGRRVAIPHASRAGVEAAFRGVQAGGSTFHASGLAALDKPPADAEWILVIIGDQEETGHLGPFFQQTLWPKPSAVAYLEVRRSHDADARYAERSAADCRVPFIRLDASQFADATDPYQMPRLWRRLIAAAPVPTGDAPNPYVAKPRVSLIDQVLATEKLRVPPWARAPRAG